MARAASAEFSAKLGIKFSDEFDAQFGANFSAKINTELGANFAPNSALISTPPWRLFPFPHGNWGEALPSSVNFVMAKYVMAEHMWHALCYAGTTCEANTA